MRLYSIHTALVALFLTVVGIQLLMPPIAGSSVEASVEIKPETFNLRERGVITAFIALPDPYNVSDIDVDTIKLHVKDAGDYVTPIRSVMANGKLVVKFDASNVADHILTTLVHMQIIPPQTKQPIDLVIEGMVNEETFEGSARIQVILP